MNSEESVSKNEKHRRSMGRRALAMMAAGFVMGLVGHAIAGFDWVAPVKITTSGGVTRATGSVHDARFAGTANDYIGCQARWGSTWIECQAQTTVNGVVKVAKCGVPNIPDLTSSNQGTHWLTMIGMINETSGVTFGFGSDALCKATEMSVWNSSDYL